MVPVTLRLRNFMSYGTAAPELDFRPIHVACLSGGNGQGKSALLDAITWAVWGEARKSSGSRKPDDEILRIGTQRMQVVYTFDADGQRYRIDRTYQRSATGKTSRSELELEAYDPGGDSYVSLTGGSQRETQETILRIVGLDYDTFINSAFLVQGRSDEFTKKRPSERKEILSRILNLDRFQYLYARARDRARRAKTEAERHALEIERLTEAIAHEKEWKQEHEVLATAIEDCQRQLKALRQDEQELAAQLARFDAYEREKEVIEQGLATLAARRKQLETEYASRAERIEEAEQLLAQAEVIQGNAEAFRSLEAERDQLDRKQDRHRTLERKLAEQERLLAEKRHALQNRLSTLEAERRAACTQYERCEQQLADRPVTEKQLQTAREAQQRLQGMQKKVQDQQRLQEKLREVEQSIHGQREALQGELRALEERCLRDGRALPDLDKMKHTLESLTKRRERSRALEEQLERIQQEGQDAREAMRSLQGRLEARQAELHEEREAYQAFQRADGDECPLCGTELTSTHRGRVLREYRDSIQKLEAAAARLSREMEKAKKKVDALRERYRKAAAERSKLDGIAETLATTRERYERAREGRENLQQLRKQADELRTTIESETFSGGERKRAEVLRGKLQHLHIDADALEALREQAAQAAHHERRLREAKALEREKKELSSRIAKLEDEIGSARSSLEGGTELAGIETRIRELRKAMTALQFDPERLRSVREQLRELADAPTRLKDLEHARRSRSEWVAQQQNLQSRMKEVEAERAAREERLEEIETILKQREVEEEKQRKIEEKRTSVEETLQDKQRRYGQVAQQLEQVRKDRKRLKATRQELTEVKRRQRIYRHLRVAFSKHGIPSLLIEQALPEIEQRANDLLDRITDGRMRVRLETLRDKKTGGTKETLEIILTDEQGVPRAYETFSGGEAFRVNFSLRLALAQLLAERSGVQVHTLIIDEGFGTQDEEGIESLVEAIHSVKDDFEKILVITHLNELKEAFPVRIEVEKDPATGSTFEMIGI